MEHSTIAAIATAPGAGGIAVVRLSGPESYAVAAKVFHPANPAKRVEDAKGYTALFGHFMEGEEAFDEGVALFFREPHSYTGEDSAEFHCHGSPVVLPELLSAKLLLEMGNRMFSRSGFIEAVRKMDEEQKEQGCIYGIFQLNISVCVSSDNADIVLPRAEESQERRHTDKRLSLIHI